MHVRGAENRATDFAIGGDLRDTGLGLALPHQESICFRPCPGVTGNTGQLARARSGLGAASEPCQ